MLDFVVVDYFLEGFWSAVYGIRFLIYTCAFVLGFVAAVLAIIGFCVTAKDFDWQFKRQKH